MEEAKDLCTYVQSTYQRYLHTQHSILPAMSVRLFLMLPTRVSLFLFPVPEATDRVFFSLTLYNSSFQSSTVIHFCFWFLRAHAHTYLHDTDITYSGSVLFSCLNPDLPDQVLRKTGVATGSRCCCYFWCLFFFSSSERHFWIFMKLKIITLSLF